MPSGLTIDGGVAAVCTRLAKHGLVATDEIGIYRPAPRGRRAILHEGIRLVTDDDSTLPNNRMTILE